MQNELYQKALVSGQLSAGVSAAKANEYFGRQTHRAQ
jgi:hypothetical protein